MPSWQQLLQFVLNSDPRLQRVSALSDGLQKQLPNNIDLVAAGDGSYQDALDLAQGRYLEQSDFDDFIDGTPTAITTSAVAAGRWMTFLSGTGASVIPTSNAGLDGFNRANGCAQLFTGSLATGAAGIQRGWLPSGTALGALDLNFRVAFGAVPTAAQNTTFEVGLIDSFGLPAAKLAIGLNFNATPAKPVLFGTCMNNAVASTTALTDASSIVSALSGVGLTMNRLRISVASNWSSVTFFAYYNQWVTLGTLTTNLPTAFSNKLFFYARALKTAGTTGNTLYVDKFFYRWNNPTP